MVTIFFKKNWRFTKDACLAGQPSVESQRAYIYINTERDRDRDRDLMYEEGKRQENKSRGVLIGFLRVFFFLDVVSFFFVSFSHFF